MKAIGINGSPKKEGNTYLSLTRVLDRLASNGFETEIVHIGGKPVRGCVDCKKCKENRDRECVIKDHINDSIEKVASADVLLLGSPVYFANVTPEMKAFIDRVGRVCRANDFLLKNKIGAPISVARRAGKTKVIGDLTYFFQVEQMIIPGSIYWNGLIGEKPGDVLNDLEGMESLDVLADNIATLSSKMNK